MTGFTRSLLAKARRDLKKIAIGLSLGILLSAFAFLITRHPSPIPAPAAQAVEGTLTISGSSQTITGDITAARLVDSANSSYFIDPAAAGTSMSIAGAASISGNLTLPSGSGLRPAFGPTTLSYKSGMDAWGTGLVIQDGTGNVGIGTVSPLSKLGVLGNVSVGATYGAIAAPTSGMIIEGNVGIGTTGPGAKLDIASGSIRLSDAQNIQWGGTVNYISGSNASNYISFNTNSLEQARFDIDGDLGIGTTNPMYDLHIKRTDAATGYFQSTGASSYGDFIAGADNGGGFYAIGYGPSAAGTYLGQTVAGSAFIVLSPSANVGMVATSTNYPLLFGTNATEKFRIDTTGKVGIGTTGPGATLDVAGSFRVYNPSYTSANLTWGGASGASSYSSLRSKVDNATYGWGITQYGSTYPDTSLQNATEIGNIINGPLTFITNNAEKVRITSAGKVGIGTTSPSTALQVVGTITGTTKNFEIDHPTKPGMKLVHSTVEGPEVAVFYRGESTLVHGKTVIVLPEYFEALTRKEGRTVQLTAKNGWSPLYVDGEIMGGRFSVKADLPAGQAGSDNASQQFYWEVKAVRKDVAPLQVEKSVN